MFIYLILACQPLCRAPHGTSGQIYVRFALMDSYSIVSVYRSRRHDSFNRKLAADLSRPDPKVSPGITGSIADENKKPPCNWMRRSLARISKQST